MLYTLLNFNLRKGEESTDATSLIISKLYSEPSLHYEILMLLIE